MRNEPPGYILKIIPHGRQQQMRILKSAILGKQQQLFELKSLEHEQNYKKEGILFPLFCFLKGNLL